MLLRNCSIEYDKEFIAQNIKFPNNKILKNIYYNKICLIKT